MYEKHFGFSERPFSLTPDPTFLYLGRKHSLAATMLEYGLSSDAPIVVISGEIGSGKTTLIRNLLNRLDSLSTVGLISNTHKAFGDLMQWIAMAFGLPHQGLDKVTLYRNFVDFLISEFGSGRRAVLIIDEAQNMDAEMLEELRVVSNINADKNLVLQLVLVGQPELRETLRLPKLEQFAQRISVDYHLEALNLVETKEYIQHRISVASGHKGIFTADAIIAIFQLSAGVPRLINTLCDTSLVYAFAEGRARVSGKLVREMANEKLKRGLFGAGKMTYPVPVPAPVAKDDTPVDIVKPV